ncbi:MAG: ATP-binding protein [Alphaproteobacteria bacterium]|nr:ATP-binding protein [Alphaproteobacteria bacterium]
MTKDLSSPSATTAAAPPSSQSAAAEGRERLLTFLMRADSGYGYVLVDPDGVVVDVSDTVRQLLPDTAADAVGAPYAALLSRFQEAGLSAFRPYSDPGASPNTSGGRADGPEPIEVSTQSGTWLRYDQKRLPDDWMIGLFVDITELKAREEALIQREQRLTDFAAAASEWFWETDADDVYIDVTDSLEEYTGLRPEDVIGKKRADLALNPSGDAFKPLLAHIANREAFHDFRYPALISDRKISYISISGTPVFDAENRFLGYRGVGREVTDIVQRERQETLAQTRLADAVNTLRVGILLFDATDRLVVANTRFREVYARADDEIELGASARDVLTAMAHSDRMQSVREMQDDAERAAWIEAELARWREPVRNEVLYKVGDGWFERRTSPTREGGILLIELDVTEFVERGHELTRAKEEAERANRAKTQFIAQMSHELRTPLNSVIGFAEVLRDELYGPIGAPEYKEFAGDIRDSGGHLLAIINDILDLSKTEVGNRTINREPVSLHEAAVATIRLMRQRAEQSGVTLELAIQSDLPTLSSEEQIVRQILINLVSNAIKFTRRGGVVTIAAELDDKDRGVVLSVRDTGIGMAEEDIPTALAPFSQIDSKLNRSFEGTGLGLPLVNGLIELHNGSMRIDSEPGVGTTVSLYFPPDHVLAGDRLSEAEKTAAVPSG